MGIVLHDCYPSEKITDEEAAEEAVTISTDLTYKSNIEIFKEFFNFWVALIVAFILFSEDSIDCDGILEEWSVVSGIGFIDKIIDCCGFLLVLRVKIISAHKILLILGVYIWR